MKYTQPVLPLEWPEPELPKVDWHGATLRECGEHRTVGPHRAWCFDCTEWCYSRPEAMCKGCRVAGYEAELVLA